MLYVDDLKFIFYREVQMKQLLFILIVSISLCAQSICIDAGHGGNDSGAVGWGLQEKNINLDVSQRLYNLMRQNGWTAYLVRNSDKAVSLSSRTSYANSLGVKRFVSIHCNAFNKTASGTETFSYTQGSSKSFSMRNSVHPHVVRAMNTVDRGTKTANFYVIKHTNMPAILCELAFIDQKNDSAKLGDSYYRRKVSEAIRDGLLSSLAALDEEIASSNEYMAPKWSLDGKHLLVTHPGFNGMNLLDVENLSIKKISSENCYNATWISSQEILFGNKQEKKIVDLTGNVISTMISNNNIATQIQDGKLTINGTIISVKNDVIFNAVVSPDNNHVVYESLKNGLHIANINGENIITVGKGNNPSWLPNSKAIVFDHAIDNGHMITESDIFLVSLENNKRIKLTNGLSVIAQRPSVSPDAKKIAFDVEGDIFIATMAEGQLSQILQITK